MPQPRLRPLRIFVSHRFRHTHHLLALKALLAPEWVEGVDYVLMCPTTDDPLHPPNDPALEAELAALILDSDLFWALAGVYASHGYYMGFESRVALSCGMPQFAIAPHHQSNLSSVATADGEREVVAWRRESIIQRSLELLPAPLAQTFRRDTVRREFDALDSLFPHTRGAIGAASSFESSDPLAAAMDQIIADANGEGVLGAIGKARAPSAFDALGVIPFGDTSPPRTGETYGRRIGESTQDILGAICRPGAWEPRDASHGRIGSRLFGTDPLGALEQAWWSDYDEDDDLCWTRR